MGTRKCIGSTPSQSIEAPRVSPDRGGLHRLWAKFGALLSSRSYPRRSLRRRLRVDGQADAMLRSALTNNANRQGTNDEHRPGHSARRAHPPRDGRPPAHPRVHPLQEALEGLRHERPQGRQVRPLRAGHRLGVAARAARWKPGNTRRASHHPPPTEPQVTLLAAGRGLRRRLVAWLLRVLPADHS